MIPAALAMAAAVSAASPQPPPALAHSVAACGVAANQFAVAWDKQTRASIILIRQSSLSQRTMLCLTGVSQKYQANFAFMAPDFHIAPTTAK